MNYRTKLLKICVVTGTRAEYGLLQWVMQAIQDDSDLELQLIVTGMHLSPEFGLTYKTIEQDGFKIDQKLEILLSSDTDVGVSKSVGIATVGFAENFDRLKPDYVMLLGDRFELLAAAQAALFARIPIAHLIGGDVTEGAFDEAIRHSITKMSHLHFVTNLDSGKRVEQLGEDPKRIFVVGNPGLEHLHKTAFLDRDKLSDLLNFEFRKRNILVTFHPVTLDDIPSQNSFEELLLALKELDQNTGIIFTKPNADTDGRALIARLDQFVKNNSNASVYTSLGQLKYLSTVKVVDAVVGNSSSGILEVPSLGTPTVNIGDRQKGRLRASSVIDCKAMAVDIRNAIEKAMLVDCSNVINPYGDGHTAMKIIELIKSIPNPKSLVKKEFHNLEFETSLEY